MTETAIAAILGALARLVHVRDLNARQAFLSALSCATLGFYLSFIAIDIAIAYLPDHAGTLLAPHWRSGLAALIAFTGLHIGRALLGNADSLLQRAGSLLRRKP